MKAIFGRICANAKETNVKPPGKSKQPSPQPSAIETKPYKPTPTEVEAMAEHIATKAKRGPRLKVTEKIINIDHPARDFGMVALMKAIGSADHDFYAGFIRHLVHAGRRGSEWDEIELNFMLSIVKGIEPRDQIEAMLAAQMAAVHTATMKSARRLAEVANIPQLEAEERAFNKLARTFTAQMSTLKEYRSKGEQKMVVQHVHIGEGGQAIVGNVNAAPEGGGVREKVGGQPHALGYAPGVEMPRQVETERATVPRARSAGS